jgi:hypothetical protein
MKPTVAQRASSANGKPDRTCEMTARVSIGIAPLNHGTVLEARRIVPGYERRKVLGQRHEGHRFRRLLLNSVVDRCALCRINFGAREAN